MNEQILCPCGSLNSFAQCCSPLLKGALAPNAKALMRSRYTAHVMRNVEYIIDTYHPSRQAQTFRHDIVHACEQVTWLGLTIIDNPTLQTSSPQQSVMPLSTAPHTSQQDVVEFIAQFEEAGIHGELHERSRFVCEAGRWFYIDGITPAPPKQTSRVGRNDLCVCGSGKKYKKCCG
ncbi:MAG: YchJ family protein [Plesiomonas sp.]|uniref:YchJ family protein n=1 Tax=Plesiomonas sp. TaxID=2486279 RepID=UPI003F3D96D1